MQPPLPAPLLPALLLLRAARDVSRLRGRVTRRDARDCRVCYGPDCYVMQCDVYWMECVLRSGPSRLRLRTYPRRLWSVLEVASPPHGTLVRS